MSELVVLDHLTLEDGELFHDHKGRPCPVPEALAPVADTHCHLGSLHGHDPALALARAALTGVRLVVVPVDPVDEFPRKWASVPEFLDFIETHIEVAHECLEECAEKGFFSPAFDGWDVPDLLDNVKIVAGVHPYGAERLDADAEARMRELLASPRCVGVGEFGLDFGPYSEAPAEAQKECFRRQLRIAHELDLPVELHLRDAPGDVRATAHMEAARILEEEGVPERGCDLHCFTSGLKVMEDFARRGCSIAFGGALTFNRSDDIREAALFCPERYLLTETDSPYMAPVPLRGEECEPAMAAFTAACLADVREKGGRGTREATYKALWNNACRFFGL